MSKREPKSPSPEKEVELLKDVMDQGYRIRVYDLVMGKARTLLDKLAAEFPAMARTPFSPEELVRRLNYYETVTKPLQNLMITGCYWGEREYERTWVKCLELIANLPGEAGSDVWVELRLYPSLLLLYSGGIAAIAAEQYSTLNALLIKARVIDERKDSPLVLGVNIPQVMDQRVGQKIPGMDKHRTPLSSYLYGLLKELLKDFIPQDFMYQRYFDLFEYLISLVYVDKVNKQRVEEGWGPVGCFGWRRRGVREDTIMGELDLEVANAGGNWPPLKAGLFHGSAERFKEVKSAFDSFLAKLNWF